MDDKLKHWVVTGDKLSTPLGRTPGGRFHASIRRIPTALRLEQWPEIINDVYRCDESWQDDNSRARTAQRQEEKKKTRVSYRVGACDGRGGGVARQRWKYTSRQQILKEQRRRPLYPRTRLTFGLSLAPLCPPPSPLYPSSDLEGGREACARGGGDATSTLPATDGCMRAWAAVVALESMRATGDGDCVPSPSPLIFHPVPFALRCPPGCLIPKRARGGGTMRVRVRVRVRDGVSGDGEMRACACGTRVIAMGGICAALRAAAVPVSVLEGGGRRRARSSPNAIGAAQSVCDRGGCACFRWGEYVLCFGRRARGATVRVQSGMRWRGGERARTHAVGAVSGAVRVEVVIAVGRNRDPCVRYASGEEGGKGAGGARVEWHGERRAVAAACATRGGHSRSVCQWRERECQGEVRRRVWGQLCSRAAAVATGSGWHITACASGGARTALSTQRSADALTAWTGGADSGSCTVWPIRKCTEKATRVGISPPSIPCNFSSLLLIQDLQSQISKLVY
ncbi:hypothetical protein DFH06DRAFT_1135218 [Mycena polygramma]|nr:hypothetical protein DFH06DRAFT_1135218 [Mycena polygramma]